MVVKLITALFLLPIWGDQKGEAVQFGLGNRLIFIGRQLWLYPNSSRHKQMTIGCMKSSPLHPVLVDVLAEGTPAIDDWLIDMTSADADASEQVVPADMICL